MQCQKWKQLLPWSVFTQQAEAAAEANNGEDGHFSRCNATHRIARPVWAGPKLISEVKVLLVRNGLRHRVTGKLSEKEPDSLPLVHTARSSAAQRKKWKNFHCCTVVHSTASAALV